MSFNVPTHKLIRTLGPFEVYDIITRGVCPEIRSEAERICLSLHGKYFLSHWMNGTKFDVLNLFLSDSGFQAYTEKDRAKELESEFKSWGLFYNVWSRWYGGNTWIVGFNFDHSAFEKLYSEYIRSKKLENLLNDN